MSSEDDTRRLLKYRSVLENRINTLELEKSSLRNAIAVLDTQIVRQGFRKPTLPNRETLIKKKGFLDDQISIKSKDGHILGTINIENNFVAKAAIQMLIKGSLHKNVYRYLNRKRREFKKQSY